MRSVVGADPLRPLAWSSEAPCGGILASGPDIRGPRTVAPGIRWCTHRTPQGSVTSPWRRPGETHLPAQQPSSCPQARFPAPHVRPSRAFDHQESPPQGPSSSVGLRRAWVIGRIGRRDAFERFHRSSRSARAGCLRVSLIEADPEGPAVAVAFAVPRSVGTAVQRNAVRRRLRAVLRGLDAERRLPDGWYLVMVRPTAQPGVPESAQLQAWVEASLAQLPDRKPTDV